MSSINYSRTAQLLEIKSQDEVGSVDSIIVLSLLTIAMCVTIFGNGLVLIAWLRHQSIRVPQNVFIVSLSFVDFLVGLIIFPLDIWAEVAPWNNLLLCKFRLVAIVGLCTVSIFHLIAIAWDRYKLVVYGTTYIQRRTTSATLQIVAGMWLLSFWIAAPPMLNPEKWISDFDCFFDHGIAWVVHNTLGSFVFPVILMMKLYLDVFKLLKQRLERKNKAATVFFSFDTSTINVSDELDVSVTNFKGHELPVCLRRPGPEVEKATIKRQRRTLRVLGAIIGLFLLCWLPFFTAHVLKEFVHVDRRMFVYLCYLGHANSAVNPIIYATMNKKFRLAFLTILKCNSKTV